MTQHGSKIAEISPEDFLGFAKRYATSPEIGPIQTSLDGGANKEVVFDRVLVGPRGCETALARNITSKSYLRGLVDLIDAFSEPDRNLKRFLGTFVSNSYPWDVEWLASMLQQRPSLGEDSRS